MNNQVGIEFKGTAPVSNPNCDRIGTFISNTVSGVYIINTTVYGPHNVSIRNETYYRKYTMINNSTNEVYFNCERAPSDTYRWYITVDRIPYSDSQDIIAMLFWDRNGKGHYANKGNWSNLVSDGAPCFYCPKGTIIKYTDIQLS